MSKQTKQEELHDKIFKYVECNVVNNQTKQELYAIEPTNIKRLINSEVTSVLDELESKKVIGQKAEDVHTGEYNKWYIPYEAIQSIRSKYE